MDRGTTIVVSCTIRYGGPAQLSQQQDPILELMLDHEPAFPTGLTHHEAPDDTDSLHRKTLVIFVFTIQRCRINYRVAIVKINPVKTFNALTKTKNYFTAACFFFLRPHNVSDVLKHCQKYQQMAHWFSCLLPLQLNMSPLGTFSPGGFWPGGGFFPGGLLPAGTFGRGIFVREGFCPGGGFCPGVFCPG